MKIFVAATTILAALGGVLLFASKDSVDYDKKADFGRYKTYSWVRVKASNQIWQDRITAAVDEQLAAKGWTKVPSGGDAAVAALGSTREVQSYNTFYDGFGGGWYWRGFGGGPGMATTTVETDTVGTLMVDIFDAQSKRLIWRGASSDALSEKPEKNEKKLEHAAEELFKKFPPKGKD